MVIEMIKIVVMSDNHGDDTQITQLLKLEPDANEYVHCGDSETWDTDLLRKFRCVKGNNDWALNFENTIVFAIGKHRIMVTHGHRCGYFNRELLLADMARERDCDIVFCGHTHMPMHEEVSGIHIINPGSTRLPRGGSEATYCVCLLDEKQITVEFRLIENGKKVEKN